MAMRKTLAEVMDRIGEQQAERSPHESAWRDIMSLMMPFRGDVTTKSEGGARIEGVIDSTAGGAAQDFISWIKGQVAPTQMSWIHFMAHEDLRDDIFVTQLLDRGASKVLRALSESNFYLQLEAYLRDLILPGNGISYGQEIHKRVNPRTGSTFGKMNFKSVPFFDMWWTYGIDDQPIWTTREFTLPAGAAYEFFKGKPGKRVLDAMGNGELFRKFKYYNCIIKNENGIPGGLKLPEDRAWHSVWVCDDGPEFAGELEGFDWNPYVVSRLKIAQDHTYGYGHGHAIRPDTKAANSLKGKELVAVAKNANPKLMYDANSIEPKTLSGGSGGAIVIKNPTHSRPEYLESRTDFAATHAIRQNEQEAIRKALMADVISNPDTQPRSAQESALREVRGLRRMGGDADAVFHALSPIIENVASTMQAAGELPEFDLIAEQVPGAKFEIRFVSPFFTAQNQGDLGQVDAYLDRLRVMALETENQEYMDRVSPDKISAYYARAGNVPAEILNTEEEMLEVREARAAAAARQQQLDQIQQAASAAKDVAQVEGAQAGA